MFSTVIQPNSSRSRIYEVTNQDYETIQAEFDGYVKELADEPDEDLRERTLAKFQKLLKRCRKSIFKARIYRYIARRVEVADATTELKELWEAHKAQSAALQERSRPTPAASYFPQAAPIPIPSAASASYTSYTSPQDSYHRSSASSGSGHLSFGSSHINLQRFPGPNHEPQPASAESNAAFYQNQGVSYPHGPPPYSSTGGPVPSYNNSPSSHRGSSRSGYYQMQAPPQTMSIPGPAHAQGPNAQPYAYGAYAPGYGPAPSTGPGYAPGPGYGNSAPSAYGYYQPNPGPSSGPYQ